MKKARARAPVAPPSPQRAPCAQSRLHPRRLAARPRQAPVLKENISKSYLIHISCRK